MNNRRQEAAPTAASVFASATEGMHGEVRHALGVSYQTIAKWGASELAVTLRDVIASPPTVVERVGRALVTLAQARQPSARRQRSLPALALDLAHDLGELAQRVNGAQDPESDGGAAITEKEWPAIEEALTAAERHLAAIREQRGRRSRE